MQDRTILSMKEYGGIRLKLNELMESRALTRNRLARAANTRFEVIDKWCSGSVEKLDMDVLARICYVLDCRVEDILEYENQRSAE